MRVREILEACEQALEKKGVPVKIEKVRRDYFAHPTAVIDQPCEIGEGTKIWYFSHVMAGAKVGGGCNLGQNVVISPAWATT